MNYCAYITTINNISKHSNADRLQIVEVFGLHVIVDNSYHNILVCQTIGIIIDMELLRKLLFCKFKRLYYKTF